MTDKLLTPRARIGMPPDSRKHPAKRDRAAWYKPFRFRPPPAGEQGDESPPPAPPTLFPVPGQERRQKKTTPAS